ncbi:MAG TPA: hypothetical protein VGN57_08465 [Pirellulaceae bacterium]|jgi:hypothetical protein|nr:hypothetical protein [Pirellulaceae bacterium]
MSIGYPSRGISKEANQVRDALKDVQREFQSAVSLGDRGVVLGELHEVWANQCVEGWDGDTASPILLETKEIADRVIDALPSEIESPSVSGDADGYIVLEWYRNSRRLVAVSIHQSSWLSWAGLAGSAEYEGRAPFYDTLPHQLLNVIREVCS